MKAALICIVALCAAIDPSHTGIKFITESDCRPVPDGGTTILLLGITLVGLAAIRWIGTVGVAASAKRVVVVRE